MAARLEFGDLVLCRYLNWKHDQTPLAFVLYSDALYTHGLNSHYLSKTEAEQLRRLLSYVPGGQSRYVYDFLKSRMNSVLRAYRCYKTPLIYIIKKWRALELKDDKTQKEVSKFFNVGKDYQRELQKTYQTPASKPQGVTAAQQSLLNAMRVALNKLQAKKKR